MMRTTLSRPAMGLLLLCLCLSTHIQAQFCSGTTSLTTISGILTDGSGPSDYANNSSCEWLIEPPGVTSITLTFTFFDLQAGDQVRVYDGNSAAAPLLGTFTGSSLPAPITTLGGAMFVEFTTNASGTAEGWNAIYSTTSNGLYWIGDGGDWNDPANWSTSSGGLSCGCIPTANDNVFFDNNSFSTFLPVVNIDADAFCKSMDWTGVTTYPLLDGNQDIFVFGSLILTDMMFTSFTGKWFFEADIGSHVLRTRGIKLGNIDFVGLDGSWNLLDELEAGVVNVVDGNLYTNDFDMELSNFWSNSLNDRIVDFGSSTVTLTSFGSAWLINVTNLVMDASQTHFVFPNGSSSVFPTLTAPGVRVYKATFNGARGQISQLENIEEIIFNCSYLGTINAVDTVGIAYFQGDMSLSGASMDIQEVTVDENGSISGNHTIHDLTFTAGKIYEFGSGSNTTLPGAVDIQGSCDLPITMRRVSTSNATILRSAGSLNIDRVRLFGITGSGGATFNATNCSDLGSNLGWNITNPAAQTLYWVGGTGTWDDPNNWSTTSGGPAAGCLPTPYDHVIFDANSFPIPGHTVTIDDLAYCQNMDWTNATNGPRLEGNSDLNVYGSLRFTPAMDMEYEGFLRMKGDAVVFLESAGHFIEDLYFEGPANFNLLDSLSVDNILFNDGDIYTNGHPIRLRSMTGSSGPTRNFFLDTSTVRLYSNGTSWNANAIGMMVHGEFAHLICEYLPTSTFIYTTIRGNNTSTYGEITFLGNHGQIQSINAVGTLRIEGSARLIVSNVVSINSLVANAGVDFSGTGSATSCELYGDENYFSGTWTFTNLLVDAGSMNTFQPSGNYAITSTLFASGTCTDKITFESTSTSPASIDLPSTLVVFEYGIFRNMISTVPGVAVLNNTIDAGGNSGWIFISPSSLDLYWVGGSGSWHDAANWAGVSGGLGGLCVPSEIDNVIFDNNSFTPGVNGEGVSIDEEAFCQNMTWTTSGQSPALIGNAQLNISGSLSVSPDIDWLFEGHTYFTSADLGETISMGGNAFNDNIYFTGTGEWTLAEDLENDESIFHERGSLDINGLHLTSKNFYSNGNLVRDVNLTGDVTVSNTFQVSGTNASVNTLNSNIYLTSVNSNFYGNSFTYDKLTFEGLNGNVYNNNFIEEVTFLQNGRFHGSNFINTLKLQPNYTYTFTAGTTNTIGSNIHATGVPGGPVSLKSSSAFTRAVIAKNSGAVCLDYTSLESMEATGGAFFFAGANAIDLGNNLGWFYTSCSDACPQILDVNTELVGPTTATLNWSTAIANFQYQVRIREVGTLPWNSINLIPGAPDFYNATGLSNTVDYEWQVRQVCEPTYTLISEWSDTVDFTAQCNPPSNLATDIILSKAVRVQWRRASEAAYYEIRGRRIGDPTFTAVNLPKFPFYFDKTGLGPGQTFEWQMRTFCEPGGILVSDWSNLNVFTTPSGRTGESVNVSVFPNPFTSQISVVFDATFEAEQPLQLIDIAGRVHYTGTTMGAETILIPRNDLPAGTYFLQIGGESPQVIQLTAH